MKFIDVLESNLGDFNKLKKDMKVKGMEEVYDELIRMLTDKTYPESVEFIDTIIKEPKLKWILSLGFGGEYANVNLTLNKTQIPVVKLIPTQNEIGTDETLKYIAEGKYIDICFKNPVIRKNPIVTYQNTFIVDGHHRWSETYVCNPNAVMECVNIDGNLSPISMLKAVQATIGSNLGTLNTKNAQGKNLFTISDDEIRTIISNTITPNTITNIKKYVGDIDVIEYLVRNCMRLKSNNHPIIDAPKRGDMPQTTKDPNLFKDLKNGVTEI